MLKIATQFDFNQKVKHLKYGNGEVIGIKWDFWQRTDVNTYETDLRYEVSFDSGDPPMWLHERDLEKVN